MTLDTEYIDFIRDTTRRFLQLYSHDADQGRTAFVSMFIAPLGALTLDDRARITRAIISLAQDIGEERFEDGQDYADFLKAVLIDRLKGN